jgi:hypothetical protein
MAQPREDVSCLDDIVIVKAIALALAKPPDIYPTKRGHG